MPPPEWNWAGRLAYSLPLAVVVLHASFTVVAAGPISPLTVAMAPQSVNGIGRLFTGDWTFLAVNPMASDEELGVACLHDKDDINRAPYWRSLSAPFVGWRAGANSFARRLEATVIEEHFGSAPWTERWRAACTAGIPEACERLDGQLKIQAPEVKALLAAIGARACVGRDPAVRWAALRYAVATPTPWSQRFQPVSNEVKAIDLGVYPTGSGP